MVGALCTVLYMNPLFYTTLWKVYCVLYSVYMNSLFYTTLW